MIAYAPSKAELRRRRKPALGLTMFGVTTPCVQAVTQAARGATTTASCSMPPAPAASRWRSWSTRACFPGCSTSPRPRSPTRSRAACSARDRRGSMFSRRRPVPYVGSCGALDMVNFWAMDTVPAHFRDRRSVSPQHQCHADAHHAGGERAHRPLHRRQAQPHAQARCASSFPRAASRPRRAGQAVPRSRRGPGAVRRDRAGVPVDAPYGKLIRLPHHINDAAFAEALVADFARSHASRQAHTAAWPASLARTSCRSCSAQVRARRADHRRRRRHRPVGQVRGGGRHRPHRDLQLRPLPHGRARLARRADGLRQRQRDRARHGARGAAGGEAHAGAGRRQRHRSVSASTSISCNSLASWASPASRTFPRSACSTARSARISKRPGMGYGLEVDLIRARAGTGSADHALCVLRAERARDGEGGRRHHRLPPGPDHRRRDRRRDRAAARGLRAADRRLGESGARREP